VRILARSWNSNSARPVIVQMRQLVSELLQVVRLETGSVLDDIVAGRIHGSLPNGLRNQEEVVSFWQCYNIVNNSPARRIRWLPGHLEEPGIDSLTDDDVGEKQLIIRETGSSEAILDCSDLMLHHVRNLSIANSIPKKKSRISHEKKHANHYLYIMILAGRLPLISAYFLRALAMAGHMLSLSSCAGLVWRFATLRYLVKVLFILATTAPTDLPF